MKYTLEKKDGIEYYSIPNLRKVQLAQLELLKIVDKVAQDNGIDYWLDGGTLLGAVRHRGFILWDDDVDICLLKKDYDKLIPLLNSYIANEKDFELMYYGNEIPFWAEYFINKKITTIHDGIKKNVRIDIIPMKLTKITNFQEDKKTTDKAGYYVYGKTKYFPEIKKELHTKTLKEALHAKKLFFQYFINSYLNNNFEMKDYSNLFINYSFNDLAIKREREYYSYDDIYPLIKIEFEGYRFPAPHKTHNYLQKLYKDYENLPDLKYRKPANEKFVFNKKTDSKVNKRYTEYWNSYFYMSTKKHFKIKMFINQLLNNGLGNTYQNTIIPFIKRGFKFK